ncbi:hypothetical protein [Janthinobacterium sp.]|uniref:hypothetical protein n=1 Tax=Janthinobacterium sp. TaxID=1871054 RepID=UPI00293D6F54|nr:hypothetical protein [Janthinobacterium sp.]
MHRYALFLLLGCSACGAGTPAPPETPAATLERIRALVGAAACSESTQCRTLALGVKACGGPDAYLAWSAAATQEPALRALAARYRAEREAENARAQEASDCRLVVDPGAQCRLGVCVLGAPGAARAD